MKSPKLSPMQKNVLLKMEPGKWICLCGETADGKRWMKGLRKATVEALFREKLIRKRFSIWDWEYPFDIDAYFKLTRKGLKVRKEIQATKEPDSGDMP